MSIVGAEAAFLRGAERNIFRHRPRAVVMELYGGFFAKAKTHLDRQFSRCYRCAIREESYQLEFLPLDAAPSREVSCPTSPTYVFCDEAL